MQRPDSLIYLEWIRKAEDDESAVKALDKEGGPASVMCFLAQQMAEKCLKAILVYNK